MPEKQRENITDLFEKKNINPAAVGFLLMGFSMCCSFDLKQHPTQTEQGLY